MMDNKDNYDDFEALLNDYLPTEENARIRVMGTISQKDRNFIYLDVPGQRTSVRVKADELEGLEKGDQVEILLIGETDDGDFIIGSRRRILLEEGNDKIEKALETREPIRIKLTKRIKGGFIGEYNGVQGFLPNSLSEIPQDSDENIEGREMDVIIKEIKGQKGAKGRKITFSKKDVTLAEAAKEFENLKVGDEITAIVSNIFDFGLAVKISHLNGFVHISEVSWKKLNKLSDNFKIGDEIKGKIIELEPEKRNVKLSMKALVKNPWETFAENYKIDDTVEGIVTKILQYGIFVQIIDGVEGLVHMSDFTWNKKRIRLEDFVKIGDNIKVKVIDFDSNERKLKLGIKQLSENPWNHVAEHYNMGTVATGIVAEVKPFGIFVEVEPGIDVFIHQTDFTWKGEENKSFAKGDKVEFKIIETDFEDQKLKGSIKALTKSPWEKTLEEYKVGQIVEKEIKSVMDFGLFITLANGVDGFIPTQLASKDFVKELKDKFTPGQLIKAQIIEINNEKERIKLSIKKIEIDEENKEHKEMLEKYGTSGVEE
ncbi:S1 RNA-binding domain-containing protein [Fusobacterium sp. PH5-44]|uniref:S1 RNA-binding domain-containing protein n=1 Tax=unclassified Fusobacterium TaxID=2648384 RepID=UPI003D1A7A49